MGCHLAVVVGVNSVIALYYYANVAKTMWMDPVPDGDTAPVRVPFSLGAALAVSITLTVAFGVSNLATRFGELATSSPPSRTPVGPPRARLAGQPAIGVGQGMETAVRGPSRNQLAARVDADVKIQHALGGHARTKQPCSTR